MNNYVQKSRTRAGRNCVYQTTTINTRHIWGKLCDLPLEAGKVHTYVPVTATARDLLHFAWHLNTRQELEAGTVDYEYLEKEIDFIADYFQQMPAGVAIFRGEPIYDRARPIRSIQGMTAAILVRSFPNNYGKEAPSTTEIYHLLRASDQREEIAFAYERVERMPMLGALTSLPERDEVFVQGREISTGDLETLASNTKSILMSAYGNDAILIWTRA